jgi:hypothetical protein
MSYVLADERNQVQKKPVFSPTPIFFLSIFFLPLAVPFWIINWGRLGNHKMRLLAGGFGIFGIVLPFLLAKLVLSQGWKSENLSFIMQFYRGLFALGMYLPMKDAIYHYVERGGKKAPIWPVAVAALLALAFNLMRASNQLN